MSIGGIGNYINTSYIGAPHTDRYGKGRSFIPPHNTGGISGSADIRLHYTGENGNNALTAVGFADGSSISVYKPDNYDASDPEYMVRYWDKDGNPTDKYVKINEVDPQNADYLEMLAYAAYSDSQGYTDDAVGDFMSSASGTDGNITYDEDGINVKKNFMNMIREFMQMQYDNNNLRGYLSMKKFYDYMTDKG